MKHLLMTTLATSMLFVGCQSEVKTEKEIVAPEVILKDPDVPLSEAAEEPDVASDTDLEFDSDGILICEEDEDGICLDDVKQNLRAEQLKERHYGDTYQAPEVTPDAVEVVDYEEPQLLGFIRPDAPPNVDPSTLPPLRVWGRDLSNYMSQYPRETEAKYGQRKLIINGMVSQAYTNGVLLGGTFVEVPSHDLHKGDNVTVYCHGAYAANSYDAPAVGIDCFR